MKFRKNIQWAEDFNALYLALKLLVTMVVFGIGLLGSLLAAVFVSGWYLLVTLGTAFLIYVIDWDHFDGTFNEEDR